MVWIGLIFTGLGSVGGGLGLGDTGGGIFLTSTIKRQRNHVMLVTIKENTHKRGLLISINCNAKKQTKTWFPSVTV